MSIPVPRLPTCATSEGSEVGCSSVEHVVAGAAWLDVAFPGWERKIDLGTLNINSAAQCVCGQVVPVGSLIKGRNGGYDEAEAWLMEVTDNRWADGHLGFVWPKDQDAWVALIKERFDSGTLSDV